MTEDEDEDEDAGIIERPPHAGVSHVTAMFTQVYPHLDEHGRSKEYTRFRVSFYTY